MCHARHRRAADYWSPAVVAKARGAHRPLKIGGGSCVRIAAPGFAPSALRPSRQIRMIRAIGVPSYKARYGLLDLEPECPSDRDHLAAESLAFPPPTIRPAICAGQVGFDLRPSLYRFCAVEEFNEKRPARGGQHNERAYAGRLGADRRPCVRYRPASNQQLLA
jgi:hypothetical protein